MTRFRDSNFAAADNLELIPLYNDDRIGVDPDPEQLGMRCYYRFQVMFAMTLGNMLIYRAVGQEAKTALMPLRHHNLGTAGITPHEVRSQNARPRGTTSDHPTALQPVSQLALHPRSKVPIAQSPFPS